LAKKKTIIVNSENLRNLKFLYKEAVKTKMDKFKFQGGFLVTTYAKFLIEHMENTLNNG